MTVIPLRPRGRSPVQGSAGALSTQSSTEPGRHDPVPEPCSSVPRTGTPLHGSFRSPSGRSGTMTGSVRLEGVEATTAGGLWVRGVFTGELVDADGSHIGTTSRRQAAPARIARDLEGSPTVVGPLQVDLLGLTVTVRAFVVEADASD